MTRREFNRASVAASAAALTGTSLVGCSSGGELDYETLVADTWRHSHGSTYQGQELLRELVRYGTLAANSHNTQPWRFQLEHQRITVRPDYSRRCSAVDPDDHHVFASLGCAVENIVVAAKAHGLEATVSMAVAGEDAIHIDLDATASSDSPLFQAIVERQCTRAQYDGKQMPGTELATLEPAARVGGVDVQIFTAKTDLEQILEYVVAGNSVQMNDEAFISELKDWLRFNESAAVARRDGLFAASSGNPTAPTWMGNILFDWFFKQDSENDKYRDHIRSSAGVIAFIAERNDKQGWVNAGRSYQRFALQSTALGLRHAFINQAVEVPQVRAQFADYLGIGRRRPNLLVRFGHGPKLPQSLRRPLDDVLIS